MKFYFDIEKDTNNTYFTSNPTIPVHGVGNTILLALQDTKVALLEFLSFRAEEGMLIACPEQNRIVVLELSSSDATRLELNNLLASNPDLAEACKPYKNLLLNYGDVFNEDDYVSLLEISKITGKHFCKPLITCWY